MTSPDQGLLEDMLNEARAALEFVSGLDEAAFLQDRKTQHPVVRCLEIIGEAASRISDETRAKLAVPWKDIVAQRHIAIHHYGKLQMPRIWATVRDDLPSLAKVIEEYQS